MAAWAVVLAVSLGEGGREGGRGRGRGREREIWRETDRQPEMARSSRLCSCDAVRHSRIVEYLSPQQPEAAVAVHAAGAKCGERAIFILGPRASKTRSKRRACHLQPVKAASHGERIMDDELSK